MAGQFEGKVAMVTGAGSGLGRVSSLAFAKERIKVVVDDVNVEGGEETVEMIKKAGGEAIFVKADVTKETEVQMLVNKVVETYGRFDYAHNNAGLDDGGASVINCTEQLWREVIDLNLMGVWLCMKHELIYMTKQGTGAIVNTASIASLIGVINGALYAASKWGVLGLTKSAALEYAKTGIRINAICPGGMKGTGMYNRVKARDPELIASLAPPRGKEGTPEEVAEAVIWLCSDAASYVLGVGLCVDGGAVIP